MRPEDLDVPLVLLCDALQALRELPGDPARSELHTHLANLTVRVQSVINSGELLQRRLERESSVRSLRSAPVSLSDGDALASAA